MFDACLGAELQTEVSVSERSSFFDSLLRSCDVLLSGDNCDLAFISGIFLLFAPVCTVFVIDFDPATASAKLGF